MMKQKCWNLKLILPALAILAIAIICFFNGRGILDQSIGQMQDLEAHPYALPLATIYSIRELTPIFVGIVFCILIPFGMLCYQDGQGGIVYKKFFIILLLIIPFFNIFAMICSFFGITGPYFKSEILNSLKEIIKVSDIIFSLVKSICFAGILGLLSYFVSKPFLKKKDCAYTVIFSLIFIPLGVFAIFVTDFLLTYLFYTIGKH